MSSVASQQLESVDITVPQEQEGSKAVIQGWLCADGTHVRQHAPLVELETDKVVMEVASPADGVLEVLLPEGEDVAPGALLGRVHPASATPSKQASCAERAAPAHTSPVRRDDKNSSPGDGKGNGNAGQFDPELRLSPAVRKLLAEHDLDPSGLEGTGKGGRLTREDVVSHIEKGPATPKPATLAAQPAPAASTARSGDDPAIAASVPHDRMRHRIAEHMHHSVSTAPHVTAVFEVDFSAIIAHRKRHKENFARQNANLTFTAYFIAACVGAMQAVPQVNSRWHDNHLDLFSDVNIGIGTALGDNGLIVPVIKHAQEKSLLGIALELQRLTEAARSGALKPTDVQGGTFTISNHGVSGSLLATPIIINQPQSAILGVGALQKRVVVREIDGADSLQIRPMAYVSLTIDHRVIDGAQTNAWLKHFRDTLQNWET